ncbi:amidohydrolase family protein [Mycobacterium kansasii]|uniref:Amidohydrolase family protein n=1 Tax=Mycobacterium kansasii TaxID=1768 RepID=A0A1V3WTU9_MYCKA|nr:amidohydrolase family protein [Mycobacterium kansasii]
MLIRRATLLDGTRADIRVGALIDEVADGLVAAPGERVLDAAGGTVLPGLHDHHMHLRSAAAALESLFVGPPAVLTKELLAQSLSKARPSSDGWIRAIGYHESVAGRLDRDVLDALVPDIPLRIQHRSGALWILNSAALGSVGLAGHPDGRLPSADSGWSDGLPRREADLVRLSDRLTSMGVTGVTDATPDLGAGDMESLLTAHRRGEFRPEFGFWRRARRSCMTSGWIWTPSRPGSPAATTPAARWPCTA